MSYHLEFSVEEIPALVDQAVEQRLARPNLAAELIAIVPALARAVCDELTARRFYGPFFVDGSDERGRERCYEIVTVKQGRLRNRRSQDILVRSDHPFGGQLLYDPFIEHGIWDPTNPPYARYGGLLHNVFSRWHFASAKTLAQFAKDAGALIENVIRRETAATNHLAEGVAAADEAFNLLAAGR